MSRFRWIYAQKAEGHSVRLACSALCVAPSSYYEWQTRHGGGPSETDLDEAYLVNEIRLIHDTLDDSYGSPRLARALTKQMVIDASDTLRGRVSGLSRSSAMIIGIVMAAAGHDHDSKRRRRLPR